jgi:hypothetical protein
MKNLNSTLKHFYAFILLIFCYTGFSQSLPFYFEGDISTVDFVDFDGGVATVTTNPNPSGINISESVAQIIRYDGAKWSGSKILLTDNLDFSVNTKISMKVYTEAAVGTTMKLKLEGSGSAVDVDAVTTVSGAWETLEWIFAGTENNLNVVAFMFDFGNVGDGSVTSTFYFDDVEQVSGPTAPQPTTLPIDFESGIVNTDFLNYNGSIASVISNPQLDANNSSATVCQIVKDGGSYWGSSKIFLNSAIDLSTSWHISMKVFTTAPIGTRIKLELQKTGASTSLDKLTTVSGAWETISWNFDGQANDYNSIQFMFDFGTVGDGTSTSTFLFDDVQQFSGPSIPDPIQASLPIDFENSVVTSDFTNFFGAQTTVIPNPHADANNPSATVGKFLRSGGSGYMRSKLRLTDYIADMSTAGTLSMKVYTDAPVGTLLKFKLESSPPNIFGKEQDAVTTVSGEWATYTWDLSNADNPIYDVLTLMLGYGGPNDASANATFLFDDIKVVSNFLNTDFDASFSAAHLTAFPNPTKNLVTIHAKNTVINSIIVYNIVGNAVMSLFPSSDSATVDIAHLASGIYIAEILTASGKGNVKLLKE